MTAALSSAHRKLRTGRLALPSEEPAALAVERALLGVVLAAGRGSRMGLPKALLAAPCGNPLAVVHARHLRRCGCAAVLVAVPPELRSVLERRLGGASRWTRVVAAETADAAQSLQTALHEAPADTERVLITPVDRAPCGTATARALLRGAGCLGALAAIPVFRGRGGHPVLVQWSALAPYREAGPPPPPLRDLLRNLGGARLRVAVADPTVVQDWDYPADLPPGYAAPTATGQSGAR